MSEFRVEAISNKDGSYGPQVCGITTFTGSGMQLPSGPTEFRGGRGRAVFMGAYNIPSPYRTADMNLVEIATKGNATDFGQLTLRRAPSCCSSSTRGVAGGGADPSVYSTIDYTLISSQGGAYDFGDLTIARRSISSMSNNTRGFFVAGVDPSAVLTMIDVVNLATTGTADNFGDTLEPNRTGTGTASPTRGVQAGGYGGADSPNGASPTKKIRFLNLQSQGDEEPFGDLFSGAYGIGSCSNGVRAVFTGGGAATSPTYAESNVIQFVTISTQGNAQDFGDLTEGKIFLSATSNSVRGLVGGGFGDSPLNNATNKIEFITIASTGDATDFGDLTASIYSNGSFVSDSHGGLAQ